MFEILTIDLDDTLWDAGPVLRRAEQAQFDWLAKYAPRVTQRLNLQDMQVLRRRLMSEREELRHDFTALRIAALRELLAAEGYDATLAVDAVEHFLDIRSQVELFSDVAENLDELKRRFRLVAITNGNADLERAGLAEHFELVLSPAVTGVAKPDPAMFAPVFERFSVGADRIAHIGDDPYYDVEAAHRANVASIWVDRTGREWPDEHRRPHARIESFHDLDDALTAAWSATA